jgi:hypothetical protein
MNQVRANGSLLVSNLRVARNVFARTRGLMFSAKLDPGEGLEIRPCNSIHMMFMRFRIDAVFFDKSGVVVKVAPNLRTWVGLAFGGRRAAGVLELPSGSAHAIQVGHQLEWSDDAEETV